VADFDRDACWTRCAICARPQYSRRCEGQGRRDIEAPVLIELPRSGSSILAADLNGMAFRTWLSS